MNKVLRCFWGVIPFFSPKGSRGSALVQLLREVCEHLLSNYIYKHLGQEMRVNFTRDNTFGLSSLTVQSQNYEESYENFHEKFSQKIS